MSTAAATALFANATVPSVNPPLILCSASGGTGKFAGLTSLLAANAASPELPASQPWSQCPGISDPATEVKKPCYKCINDNAVKIKKDNAQEVEQKLRERAGAGNDSYMMSLVIGNNYDADGHFICNKPKRFVNIDRLGWQPWDLDDHFQLVGKMYDGFGNIVDRPDITVEQKALQYESAYCIAQRNASLAAYEMGSLNPAYAGMTVRATVPALNLKSPASTVGSASSGALSATSVFTPAATENDTPLTACFSDVPKIKDAAAY